MRIIKAHDPAGTLDVQGLLLSSQKRLASAIQPDPVQQTLDALGDKVETLSALLVTKESELADLRQDLVRAREEGLAAGRIQGRAEAQSREAERLEAVDKSLADGASQLAAALDALEPLALLIARESLDKILGDPEAYPELITLIIRRQLAGLREQGVLAIEVSAEDFSDSDSDSDAVAQLAVDIARPATMIEIKKDMVRGSCRLRLTLGAVEIGVKPQWEQLGLLLRDLAAEQAS